MPNTETAKKALRQNRKRRLQNRAQRSALRTVVKKAREAAVVGGAEAATTISQAFKKLDQSASKGLIHKNTAARLKSRLVKAFRAKEAAK